MKKQPGNAQPAPPTALTYASEATDLEVSEPGALISVGEADSQIVTARRYPRSVGKFQERLASLVTLNEETAAACMYAVDRAGETIEGPSARFAELAAHAWGNLRIDARPVAEDDRFVTSRGMAWDLESNLAVAFETRRRITNREGRRYSDDMISVTANAASSIALRNAVLKAIPTALWRPLYLEAKRVAVGDVKTLVQRRTKMIEQFAKQGVPQPAVLAKLGVASVEDITLAHLALMVGVFTAIKDGETTVDAEFPRDGAKSAQAGWIAAAQAAFGEVTEDDLMVLEGALTTAGLTLPQRLVLIAEHASKGLPALMETLQGRAAGGTTPSLPTVPPNRVIREGDLPAKRIDPTPASDASAKRWEI